jgi:hypothetical protein
LVIADLQHVSEIVPNARHDQRVRVGDVDQCQPAHPGSRYWVGRQQRRLRICLVEIFEDGQGLEKVDVAVDQSWYHHLRYSAAKWSPFSRCRKLSSRVTPFRFSAMRTRKLACER